MKKTRLIMIIKLVTIEKLQYFCCKYLENQDNTKLGYFMKTHLSITKRGDPIVAQWFKNLT